MDSGYPGYGRDPEDTEDTVTIHKIRTLRSESERCRGYDYNPENIFRLKNIKIE